MILLTKWGRYFQFNQKQISHLPSTSSIARFILDDTITDTIRIFSLNHKECTSLLLDTPRYFNSSHLESEGIQVYEAVVEAIFCEMFRLPKSHERFVYYTTLIMDLCKESLDKIPSVLGRTIKTLFSRLDHMDVECIKRFSDFFAVHLSNFAYSWRWEDWEFVLDQDEHAMQFIFVRETLQKCIRLAYYDRIKNSIPETFETHGKIFPTSAPSFSFSFQNSGAVGDSEIYRLASDLNEKISSRADSLVLETLLGEIEEYAETNPDCLDNLEKQRTPNTLAHEVLFQCLMFQGSKSFSHLLNVIEKYLPLLQKWNETMDARLLTAEITCSFWSLNTQFLEIILGKLINYRILDSKAVITWLISEKTMDDNFDRFYVWSILSGTLYKMNLKQNQIMQKIALLKEDPDSASAMQGTMNLPDDSLDNVHSLEAALEASKMEKKDIFIFCFQVNSFN